MVVLISATNGGPTAAVEESLCSSGTVCGFLLPLDRIVVAFPSLKNLALVRYLPGITSKALPIWLKAVVTSPSYLYR